MLKTYFFIYESSTLPFVNDERLIVKTEPNNLDIYLEITWKQLQKIIDKHGVKLIYFDDYKDALEVTGLPIVVFKALIDYNKKFPQSI